MLTAIAAIRPYLEFVYFLTSSLLVAGIAIGLRQLRLFQEDGAIRSNRAAKERAIEACDAYMTTFISLYSTAYFAAKAESLKSYSGNIGDFSAKSIQYNSPRFSHDDIGHLYVTSLNKLEIIAAYFVSTVADEGIGFNIIGRTYCGTVESSYDIISASRMAEAHDYWSNIVALYRMWRPRLSEAEIDAAIKTLEAKKQDQGATSHFA